MKTNLKFTVLMILFQTMGAIAQSNSGSLSGYINDSISGENLGFANVVLYQNDVHIMGTTSNEEGYFTMKNIKPGYYDLFISYMGYEKFRLRNIQIVSVMPTSYNARLCKTGLNLPIFDIPWKRPLVSISELPGLTLSNIELKQIPVERITELVALAPGVQGEHFRGQRETANAYYVDGVRITGMMGLPKNSIQQLTVFTSGIPSEYGDFLGGVVIITTKNTVNPISL